MRRLLALLVLAAALLVAGPLASAGAQRSDDGLGELWRQYPLDPQRTATTPQDTDAAPPSTTAQAPVAGSADSASAPPSPAPRGQVAASDPDTQTILIGTAIVALAAAGAAVLLVRRRRNRAPAYATVGADAPEGTISTYVEGTTDRNGIGPFEGYVSARAVAPPPITEPLYLVRDSRREQPVWVRRSEVRTLRTVDVEAAGPEAQEL